MSIDKPFKSVYRTTVSNTLESYNYIEHPEFSTKRIDLARMYRLLEDRIKHLFRLIEPDKKNKDVFSYEISNLLISVCIEVENCLKEVVHNNSRWKGKRNLNIFNYRQTEKLLKLERYILSLNISDQWEFRPFENWTSSQPPLLWYDVYNKVKHNRTQSFSNATYEMLLTAFAGLTALQLSMYGPFAFIEGPLFGYGLTFYKVEGDDKGFIIPDTRTIFTLKSSLQFNEEEQYDIDPTKPIDFAPPTQIILTSKRNNS